MGICTSSGVIRDFAGSFFVSEDNMAFGLPTRYLQLDITKVPGGVSAYDRAVQDASEEYKTHTVRQYLSLLQKLHYIKPLFYSTIYSVITVTLMLLWP